MSSDYQYIFKIILIGNSGVGKSCILKRFVKRNFEESHKCTIGVDFLMKTITINGQTVKLQLWDTAGTEKYKSMSASYYRGAHVAFVVFDITSPSSFDALPHWFESYYKNGPEGQKNVILIGNKKDLAELRQISQEDAENFARNNNMIYFETSAKDGDNIEHVFYYAAEKLLEFYKNNDSAKLKPDVITNKEMQTHNFSEIRIEPGKKKCC